MNFLYSKWRIEASLGFESLHFSGVYIKTATGNPTEYVYFLKDLKNKILYIFVILFNNQLKLTLGLDKNNLRCNSSVRIPKLSNTMPRLLKYLFKVHDGFTKY